MCDAGQAFMNISSLWQTQIYFAHVLIPIFPGRDNCWLYERRIGNFNRCTIDVKLRGYTNKHTNFRKI